MTQPVLPAALRVITRDWVSSNNILCFGRDGATLVDTGYGRHAPRTLELVATALDSTPLQRIVNTHCHSDHIGGNAALQRAHPSVEILIPAGDTAAVAAWDQNVLDFASMGQECERFTFARGYAAEEDLVLGELTWRAVASPGHHDTSLVLHCEAERVLISGDALWEHGFGVIFPALDGGEAASRRAFAAQRATLETIAALEIDTVLPGHGAPFAQIDAALERAGGSCRQ